MRCLTILLFLSWISTAFAAVGNQTEPQQRYTMGKLCMESPSFSPCGRYVYAGGGMGAILLDPESEATLRAYPHEGGACAADLNAEATRMAIGVYWPQDRTREGMIYDAKTAQPVVPLVDGYIHIMRGIKFFNNDTMVATAGVYLPDPTKLENFYSCIKFWDAKTGAVVKEMTFDGWCGGFDISSDGSLAALSNDTGATLIIDCATGQIIRELPIAFAYSLRFFDNASKIAVGSYNDLLIFDLTTGQMLLTLPTFAYDFALSPDETQVLVRTETRSELHSIADGSLVRTYDNLFVGSPDAFAPDGDRVAMIGDDLSVAVVDVASGEILCEHDKFTGNVTDVAFDPTDETVVVARSSGWIVRSTTEVQVLDTSTGALVDSIPVDQEISAAEYSPDGELLLLGGETSTAVYDAHTKTLLKTVPYGASDIYFSPDGTKVLLGGYGFNTIYWDLESDALIWDSGQSHFALAMSADGTKALFSEFDGLEDIVSLWDLTTFSEVLQLNTDGVLATAVAFSPDGTRIVATGYQLLRMWNIDGTFIRDFTINGMMYGNCVRFSPVQDQIAVASFQKCLIFNASNGNVIRRFNAHTEYSYCLDYTSNGKRIATGGLDGQAFLWSNQWNQERVQDKLIIVAGGDNDPDSDEAQRVRSLANWACMTAYVRGYTGSRIQYLSAFDTKATNAFVDAVATPTSVKNAITSWGGDSSRLTIVMIGSADQSDASFIVGGTPEAPLKLTGVDLAATLNTAQSGTSPLPEALVVLDASYSGQFLPLLASPSTSTKRLVIASTGPDQPAIIGADGDTSGIPSFTSYFLSAAFQGASYQKAFHKAQQALQKLSHDPKDAQQCMLDDNRDGVFDKDDGEYAREVVFGSMPDFKFDEVAIAACTTSADTEQGKSVELEVTLDVPPSADLSRVEAYLTKDNGLTITPVTLEPQIIPSSANSKYANNAGLMQFSAMLPSSITDTPGEYQVLFSAVSEDGLGCEILSTPTHGVVTVNGPTDAQLWHLYR